MTIELSDPRIGCNRAPVALEYAVGPQSQDRPRRAWLLGLSLPVLVVPFLNFTYNVSPLDALRSAREYSPIALLGGEFFVGPIILAWRAVLLLFKSPRKAIARAVSAFAILAWLPFIYDCVAVANNSVSQWEYMPWREFLVQEWPACLLAAILGIGVLIIVLQFRKGDKISALTTALTIPFLGNCTLCLLGFPSDGNVGYWLTFSIVILWGGEITWDAIRPIANRFRPARQL